MGFVQNEIDKINLSVRSAPSGPVRDTLYATQQALVWSVDPLNFESPPAMIGQFSSTTAKTQKVVVRRLIRACRDVFIVVSHISVNGCPDATNLDFVRRSIFKNVGSALFPGDIEWLPILAHAANALNCFVMIVPSRLSDAGCR